MTGPRELVRVAIVGGGCAGIATAWHLSALNQDESHPRTYEISVYESRPHLGGKGASTRDRNGRILEHGLHIWLGFYENAFKMMRDCYAQVDADIGPLVYSTFNDAFFSEPQIGLGVKNSSGAWEAWTGHFPPMPGLPGDGLDTSSNPFTLNGYLRRALGLVKMLIQSVVAPPGDDATRSRSDLDDELDITSSFDPRQTPATLIERMAKVMRVSALTTAAGCLQGVTIMESILREEVALPSTDSRVLRFVEALATQARRQLSDLVAIDPALRRKTEIVDLVMTIIVGLYRDKVMADPKGLDALNGIDCKDWLLKHGATYSSLDSPFVRGLYDLAFAYRDGDKARPGLAAGQALRGAMRMFFSYRGAMFWRMRSGMGEVVFAPLYRVLKKKRGVKFLFGHRLTHVKFLAQESGRQRAVRLDFAIDRGSSGNRNPLDKTGCWREANSKPQWQPAARQPKFDAVVLAMGVEAVRQTCPQLLKSQPRWRRMCEQVRTVGTQSAQLWLSGSLRELGWTRGPVVLSAYDEPFDTWADTTHALAAERRWRQENGEPKGTPSPSQTLAYFCSVIADHNADGKPLTAKDVKENAKRFVEGKAKGLWSKQDDVSLYALLVDAKGRSGRRDPAALNGQYFRANTLGSERYTLALPGTLECRISPLNTCVDVENMTIAGDWTECGFNEGCIEAAVMSGMLACRAISGAPDLDSVVGYHHP